jgi:hypothetical protein
VSAAVAVLGHDLFIEWLRNGRELPISPQPKTTTSNTKEQ